jgi:hypothetical protein
MGNASVNLAANCCSCKPDLNGLSLESAREDGGTSPISASVNQKS